MTVPILSAVVSFTFYKEMVPPEAFIFLGLSAWIVYLWTKDAEEINRVAIF